MKNIKNMRQLAMEVTRREKGKREINIAQIMEILRVLAEIFNEDRTRLTVFYRYLNYRKKKKVKVHHVR